MKQCPSPHTGPVCGTANWYLSRVQCHRLQADMYATVCYTLHSVTRRERGREREGERERERQREKERERKTLLGNKVHDGRRRDEKTWDTGGGRDVSAAET